MNYVSIVINDFEYKLRLNAKNTVLLEKALGANPVSIFMGVTDNQLPSIDSIINVLYYALQPYHAGSFKNKEAVYELFDSYIENGGDAMNLIPVLVELYQVSGIIPKDEPEGKKEKN